MIDYLEKILAMMAGWEDEESGWPERKQASPGEKNSALDEALAVPEAGVRPASGMDRPRRVYIDDRFQVDHLERLIQDGQGQAAASPPAPVRDQEPGPEPTWGGGLDGLLLTRTDKHEERSEQRGGAANGGFPLLAQSRKRRLAVENSRRRDALFPAGQAPAAVSRWEPGRWQRESQTQAQDTAQLVDRAFRRDARRYDGGFTLF